MRRFRRFQRGFVTVMEKVEIVGSVVVLASAVMVALLALTGVIK